jgi:branched-chain amino acid transport system ATP-binding protein
VLVRQLAGILDGLRRHGHSVLLVEQNVELALAAADHVYLLTSGRIVHEAPAAQLREAREVLTAHLAI